MAPEGDCGLVDDTVNNFTMWLPFYFVSLGQLQTVAFTSMSSSELLGQKLVGSSINSLTYKWV